MNDDTASLTIEHTGRDVVQDYRDSTGHARALIRVDTDCKTELCALEHVDIGLAYNEVCYSRSAKRPAT